MGISEYGLILFLPISNDVLEQDKKTIISLIYVFSLIMHWKTIYIVTIVPECLIFTLERKKEKRIQFSFFVIDRFHLINVLLYILYIE